MKITEPALVELNNILSANGAEGLEVILQEGCCGVMPTFQLVRFDEGDQPEDIQGVKILMEGDAKDVVENVIIDLQDGELIVLSQRGGCCGHGHHHEHGDHECCGHGHHHEDGDHECCGHGHHHEDGDHECCGHGHHHEDGNHECCGHGHHHEDGEHKCCGHGHHHE